MMTRSDGVETGADDPQAVAEIADLDLLRRDDVVRRRRSGRCGRTGPAARRRPARAAAGAGVAIRQPDAGEAAGGQRQSVFGTVARAWIVPLERSRALSTKSSVPSWVKSVSRRRARSAPCRRAGPFCF